MPQSKTPWTQFARIDPLTGRYSLGIFFILLQCFAWVFDGVLAQYIYEVENYQAPFMMTYVGMLLLAFLLPARLLTDYFGVTHQCPNESFQLQSSFDSLERELSQVSEYSHYMDIATRRTHELIQDRKTQWNHRKHILAALHIAPAMFCADFACNSALAHTTLASTTVVVSTQSIIVFVLAVMTSLEAYSHSKALGVLMTVVGTALTTLNDAHQDSDTAGTSTAVYGDVLAALAAVTYATYTIQVRVLCPQDDDLYSMQLLLGYIGCITSAVLFPFAIWMGCHQTQHLTAFVLGLILLKGFIDFVVADYLLFRAIILTNATTATVGLGLTIPIAFVADWVLQKDMQTWVSFVGAVAVTIGFLIVNLAADDKHVIVSTDHKLGDKDADEHVLT